MRFRRFGVTALIVLVGTPALLALYVNSSPVNKTLIYRNKSLKTWVFASRTSFFLEPTRKAAQEAIDALGTNAFPFLLAELKGSRGNGPSTGSGYLLG